MDISDGIVSVKAARKAVEAETEGRVTEFDFSPVFGDYSGVFVTLKTYPDGNLRGCIGYPEPMLPLKDALIHSAQSACHDPRFPDLLRSEAEECTVEVTILTKPKAMDCKKSELPKNIVIGKDGLIIECKGHRGLLLPQVPVEWCWGPIEYLEELSMKAGLPHDSWMDEDSIIFSFEGEIFHEESPKGEIVRG